MRTLAPLALFAVFVGCGSAPGPVANEPGTIALQLDTRDGQSATGWSFAQGLHVPAEEADLTISSSDCGARGRWVSLNAGKDLKLCVGDTDGCADWGVEIGGTDPEVVALGTRLHLLEDDFVIASFVLVDRSDTPDDWFDEPVAPFVVQLELEAPDAL